MVKSLSGKARPAPGFNLASSYLVGILSAVQARDRKTAIKELSFGTLSHNIILI